MINKLWRIVKFVSINWYIIKPIGKIIIDQSKKLYEKIFKKDKKPENIQDKN